MLTGLGMRAQALGNSICAGVAKIWLFEPHLFPLHAQKSSGSRLSFLLLYIYFIAKVLCCFGIRTEEIQSTALKNFQESEALVVAADKIPLNVPNHRFET